MGSRKSKSQTQSESESTSRFTPSAEAQRLIGSATPIIDRYINQPPNVESAPVLGFNQNQLASQQSALGAIPGIQQGFNFAQELNDPSRALGFANQAISSQALNPALNSVLSPILENFQQSILPGLQSSAAAGNALGGSRQDLATGQAVNQFSDRVGRGAAGVLAPIYGQALGGYLSNAPNLAQNYADLALRGGLLPSNIQGQVGDQQYGLAQAQASAQHRGDLINQFLPLQLALQGAGVGSSLPGGTQHTTSRGSSTSTSKSSPSGLQTALGVGSLALGGFGGGGLGLGSGGFLGGLFGGGASPSTSFGGLFGGPGALGPISAPGGTPTPRLFG